MGDYVNQHKTHLSLENLDLPLTIQILSLEEVASFWCFNIKLVLNHGQFLLAILQDQCDLPNVCTGDAKKSKLILTKLDNLLFPNM